MKLVTLCAMASLATQAVSAAIKHKLNGFTITEHPDPVKRDLLQKYVCFSCSLPVKYADEGGR